MLSASHPVGTDGRVDFHMIVIRFVGFDLEQRLTIDEAQQFITELQEVIDERRASPRPPLAGAQPAATGKLSARIIRRNGADDVSPH